MAGGGGGARHALQSLQKPGPEQVMNQFAPQERGREGGGGSGADQLAAAWFRAAPAPGACRGHARGGAWAPTGGAGARGGKGWVQVLASNAQGVLAYDAQCCIRTTSEPPLTACAHAYSRAALGHGSVLLHPHETHPIPHSLPPLLRAAGSCASPPHGSMRACPTLTTCCTSTWRQVGMMAWGAARCDICSRGV